MSNKNQSPPDPTETIGFALHHASYAFKTSLKASLKAAGLDMTPEEFIFLSTVPDGGAPQATLSRKALKDKTTITRLIDRLVAKGWVTRRENPSNRREQVILITKEGQSVRATAIKAAVQTTSDALVGISAEEIEVAKLVLRKIVTNLATFPA